MNDEDDVGFDGEGGGIDGTGTLLTLLELATDWAVDTEDGGG